MRVEELISRDEILNEANAEMGMSQAGLYLVPTGRISDMVSEPGGEAIKPRLLKPSTRNMVGSIGTSNDECKDKNKEEKSDEDGHTEEVKGQEALFVPITTNEAGERNEEDEDAEDEDVPPEVEDALVVCL